MSRHLSLLLSHNLQIYMTLNANSNLRFELMLVNRDFFPQIRHVIFIMQEKSFKFKRLTYRLNIGNFDAIFFIFLLTENNDNIKVINISMVEKNSVVSLCQPLEKLAS